MKRLSLELGGNAPWVVFDDADLDAAVDGLMAAKFRNGGQTCVSPNRVFVQSGIHDAFVWRLAARVAALQVGPASDVASQIGPMINRQAVEKIERHVADAVARGARVIVGGMAADYMRTSNFVRPTVLTGATAAMALASEETFGPVAAVYQFYSESEVVEASNATPYGLAAYFYLRDIARVVRGAWCVVRVADAMECGIVGINEGRISSAAAPFGGVKESGYGREGSRCGLDDYLDIKYLCQGGL